MICTDLSPNSRNFSLDAVQSEAESSSTGEYGKLSSHFAPSTALKVSGTPCRNHMGLKGFFNELRRLSSSLRISVDPLARDLSESTHVDRCVTIMRFSASGTSPCVNNGAKPVLVISPSVLNNTVFRTAHQIGIVFRNESGKSLPRRVLSMTIAAPCVA